MTAQQMITVIGIGATFLVAVANLIYSIINNRKTAFVNTVTVSRLRWIESLRDKVSAFVAITIRLVNPSPTSEQNVNALLRERDTLRHQIILHLNPSDPKDQAIRKYIDEVVAISEWGVYSDKLKSILIQLRDATQEYLKKEWERVKRESKSGESTGLSNN
jgi:hypothetical protein